MSATEKRVDLADLAQRFDADRQHLRAVAFRLLGSIADADDAVPVSMAEGQSSGQHR